LTPVFHRYILHCVMAAELTKLDGFRCKMCRYAWMPLKGVNSHPERCPKCKSKLWDRGLRTQDEISKSALRAAASRTGKPIADLLANHREVKRIMQERSVTRQAAHALLNRRKQARAKSVNPEQRRMFA